MKDFRYYQKLNYKIVLEYDEESQSYIVKFPELPGCIADGETPQKALKIALEVKNEWIKEAIEDKWTIPEPSIPLKTSGRVTLRLPKFIHTKLVDRAESERVSLNQLILAYLTESLERSTSNDQLEKLEKKIDDISEFHKQLIDITEESKSERSSWDEIEWGWSSKNLLSKKIKSSVQKDHNLTKN